MHLVFYYSYVYYSCYPAHMCTGKAIDLSIVVTCTKIARSQHLDACASRKYSEFVEVGKKNWFQDT